MTILIPAGGITPHGRYHLLKGDIPDVSLIAPNRNIIVSLMGGQSIPEPFANPESVRILELSGLIAPWELIQQQGANQDGVTVVDALYGPTDITMKVLVCGRDAKHTRRVQRLLFEALDAKLQSEFSWRTHELGDWWAPVRWKMRPPDKYDGTPTQQEWTLLLQGDNAFYQSYPDTDEFEFLYEDMTDTFTVDYSEQQNLGPNWPQLYSGNGIGYHYANGRHATWSDDPDSIFLTGTRRVVAGPYDGYETDDDFQVISIQFDNTPQFTVGSGAANDIWARMGRNEDGTWNGYGIRCRIGWGYRRLSYFANYVEHLMDYELGLFPPFAGEVWTFHCGFAGNPRRYVLQRGGVSITNHVESGTSSPMGPDYRGVGLGMQGGGAIITQATPGRIRQITVNSTVLDGFDIDYPNDLGPNWPLRYEGRNDAYIRAQDSEAEWVDNSGTETQEVINGPYRDFDTETDNQVVAMVLGSFPEWSAPESGANDLWGRMGADADGNWDGNGIRLRVTRRRLTITAFVDFEPVWSRAKDFVFVPYPGDKWTLVCGFTGDKRMFKVYRNGATVLEHKESGTQSLIGPAYRGIGFGVRAGGALITQATPAIVRKISAGDNAEVTQEGFLERRNAGDQIAYDEITCYGPGIFGIANGPGSTDMVLLDKLEPGEIAHIRTDPRSRAVFDYTDRTGDETKPVLFGSNPTDKMYARLKGRFTADYAIPAKEPGMRVATHTIKVSITGGNADSRIAVSLTPLRRRPE